jgi:hypothetical protein
VDRACGLAGCKEVYKEHSGSVVKVTDRTLIVGTLEVRWVHNYCTDCLAHTKVVVPFVQLGQVPGLTLGQLDSDA